MNKSSWLIPAVLALLGGAAWGIYLMATAPERYSRFRPGETLQMRRVSKHDKDDANRAPKYTPREKVELDHSQTPPRAVAVEPTHDFGSMDPFSTREHTFLIRNQGLGTLTLYAGPTTCKCTACVVKHPSVAPGGEAQVVVAWRTAGRQPNFRHSAIVYTNDPDCPEIKLVVQGAVRTHIGAEPPDFTLPRVNPQQPTIARTVIYSQAWSSFHCENFSSTLEGVTFKKSPASSAELKPFGAKSGYVVEVTLPAGLPSGEFKETIYFDAFQAEAGEASAEAELESVEAASLDAPQSDTPPSGVAAEAAAEEDATARVTNTDATDPRLRFEMGLEGKVLRRLSIQGTGIDLEGMILLGVIDTRQGTRKRLLMKVNDPRMELPVERIACQPDFVQAKVTPYLPEGKQVGLYYLDLIVPPGVPPTAHLSDNPATVEIDFDHPRVEDLRLKLEFVVSDAE